MSISVVVPIGGSAPFFIHTNLANVAETCGVSLKDFDFVFLTQKTISPELQRGFDKALKNYKFRVISADFDTWLHLELLDWAIRHADLGKWVFLQHMDTLWKPECHGWLKDTLDIVNENPCIVAIAMHLGNDYITLDSKPITQMHDYAGVYNRKYLVENNLHFMWGKICKLKLSDQVKSLMFEKPHLLFKESAFTLDTVLDGSKLLAIELATHCPERIYIYDYRKFLIHPGGYIRDILSIETRGRILSINLWHNCFHVTIKRLAIHSLISSCHFNLSESNKHILPWKILSKITPLTEKSVRDTEMFKILSRYEKPKNVLGTEKTMGVQKVKLKDEVIELYKLF